MENSLILYCTTCVHCQAGLSTLNKSETTFNCPYCGTVNKVDEVKEIEVYPPEKIILFKATEKDFQQAIGNLFVTNDNCADDIFEKIKFIGEPTIIYLPMHLFKGEYESDYRCKIKSSGDPRNGNVKGKYSYLVFAFDASYIPKLRDVMKDFQYDPSMEKYFKPELVANPGYQVITPHFNKVTAWEKEGIAVLWGISKTDAEKTYGEPLTDFESDLTYDTFEEVGDEFIVPFWIAHYTYNGSRYALVMDGLGQNAKGDIPEDTKRLKTTKLYEKIRKNAVWAGVVLFVLFWGLTKFIPAIIIGGLAWFGLSFFFKIQLKGIVANARNIRQEAMKNFKGFPKD